MCLTVDPDKHLIKVPAPVRTGSMTNPAFPDLRRKQRAKAVPPVPYGFVTDINAPFLEQILDLPEGERKSNTQHHREADDLGELLK